MRRTVTLVIELEGPRPSALDLRDWLIRQGPGRAIGRVVDVAIIDDGIYIGGGEGSTERTEFGTDGAPPQANDDNPRHRR